MALMTDLTRFLLRLEVVIIFATQELVTQIVVQ